MSLAKRIIKLGRHLPIHPQWLLGTRKCNPIVGKLQGTILDVGCADRWIEKHLATATNYIGLDYPPTGKNLYSARADVFADAARLPISSSSVDAIVCLEVLEHARDYQAALHEFYRVLKPSGTLILSMPFLYPIHDAPHDYQRLTEYGLRRDLESAGFNIGKLTKHGHSIRTAGLLFNLALVGGLYARKRKLDYAKLAFVSILVLAINLASCVLAWILPDWNALGFGYEIQAKRCP